MPFSMHSLKCIILYIMKNEVHSLEGPMSQGKMSEVDLTSENWIKLPQNYESCLKSTATDDN